MVKYERLLFCIECHDRGDRIKAKGGYLTNENDEIICKKHKLHKANQEQSKLTNFNQTFLLILHIKYTKKIVRLSKTCLILLNLMRKL